MPFKQIIPEPPRAYPELTDVLAEELRLARPDGPEDAPYIIEEHSPRHGFLHIQVIWDAWQDVPTEERGRIIMDAYERVRGTVEVVTKINSVLGLTHAEARRLGREAA